eukprot:scaffold16319_cov77-Skeletonema_menzelii.AAC.3
MDGGRSADRPIDPSTYRLIRSFGIVTTHNLHVDGPMKEAVIILENLLSGSGKPNLVGKKTTATVSVTVTASSSYVLVVCKACNKPIESF